MKYIAVLDTDDYEDFAFFEDGKEQYLHAIDAMADNGEWIYLPFKPLEQHPQKGKWLAIHTKDDTHEMTCSCCGHVVVELIRRNITEETALEYLKDRIDENKFCPNCGADMREVEE